MPAFATTGANSAANFIPEIFSKKLQAKFYASSVLPMISNTEYEGEISGQGNKVNIRTVPNVTVGDYNGSVSYADVTTQVVELNIDKAKSYAFKVDDILKVQADINFQNEASKDAAEQMRISVETDVLGNIPTAATTILDKASVSEANLLNHILEAARKLDELNIPDSDRFLVLSPLYIEMLKKSELRQAYLTGDSASPLRNGKVGTVDRFTVYQSNLLAAGSGGDAGKTFCLAGHPKATCFASQFVKTETVRLTDTFGDGIRGLKVYGYKVVVPNALVTLKMKTTA